MPRHRWISAFALLLAAAHPTDASAQPRRWWGGFGGGVGTAGFGATLDGSLLHGEHLFRARVSVHDNSSSIEVGLVRTSIDEVGLMYGRGAHFGRGNWASATAGLAFVTVEREGKVTETIGLPLEIQLISRKLPHLGVTGIANLNPEAAFAGFMLSLQIGAVP